MTIVHLIEVLTTRDDTWRPWCVTMTATSATQMAESALHVPWVTHSRIREIPLHE